MQIDTERPFNFSRFEYGRVCGRWSLAAALTLHPPRPQTIMRPHKPSKPIPPDGHDWQRKALDCDPGLFLFPRSHRYI